MKCVAATGFFDGVHLGHQKVISRVSTLARQTGRSTCIVTFWPHPRSVLQQEAYNLRLLTSLSEKQQLFTSLGIENITVLDFTKEFSLLSTEEFIERYLIARCNIDTLVVGYDHKIGHNPNQSQDEMIEICRKCGLQVYREGEFITNGMVVSSTKVRNSLTAGDVEGAALLLGRQYTLTGAVVQGNRLGRTIGFPTANLSLYDPLKLVPGNGVYAVDAIFRGTNYKGICNVGVRPTVSSAGSVSIETHILDFEEDIYGLDLTISFRGRIREERKFSSLEDLKQQLLKDKENSLKFFL